MSAYAAKDAQEERRLENAAWQDAENQRKEARKREVEHYYWQEAIGVQQQSIPFEWMEGNYD